MGYEKYYQLTIKPDWSHDQLLKVLSATAATGYSDITLVLPAQQRALRNLDDFYSLRKTGQQLRVELTVSSSNKTFGGLARLLGFRVISPTEDEPQVADTPTPPPADPSKPDTGLLLAVATLKALLISKGVFSEEEYQQMFDFVEKQWKSRPG